MQWIDILNGWEDGEVVRYPKQVKGRFQWNTSVLTQDGHCEFKQHFKTFYDLPSKQDYSKFETYIKQSKNRFATSFMNTSNNTLLIIPMPVRGKNYVTLKDFIDNAPLKQQQEFWNYVAKSIKICLKNNDKLYVSVHGYGVPYCHVRISTFPKYFFIKV